MLQNFWDTLSRPFLSLKLAYEREKRMEKEIKRYYHNSLFRAVDLKLKTHYKQNSPFHISREYQKLNPEKENLYLYGETPLEVYETFAKKWGVKASDTYLELGSGIGRGILFLSCFFHCKCIGVEWVSEYVEKAKELVKAHKLKDTYFVNSDLFVFDFPKVDFIYLFGSCLKTTEIYEICKKIKSEASLAKIITVSFPLSYYDKDFHILDELSMPFEFGTTSVYLNKLSCH